MIAIGVHLLSRVQSPGHKSAQVIAAGYRAASTDIDSLDDNEAGYRWAERHAIDQLSVCPRYTLKFTAGCQAWVQDVPTAGQESVPRDDARRTATVP